MFSIIKMGFSEEPWTGTNPERKGENFERPLRDSKVPCFCTCGEELGIGLLHFLKGNKEAAAELTGGLVET